MNQATQAHTAVKRTLVGTVVSDKMTKTVTVLVERSEQHPLYGKVVKLSNKFHAHNEGLCAMGDKVEITEHRPMSKTKNWIVTKLIEKARVV
jgi:small subunit ribosomal protein S17